EQVGWNGLSKPEVTWPWANEHPELPYKSEADEILEFTNDGVDPDSGFRWVDDRPKNFDVGGVNLALPFKPTRIGPVNIFVEDVEEAVKFYTEKLGFVVSEETE